MKVLVLGASGMLGNAMMRVLSIGGGDALEVFGTVRSAAVRKRFASDIGERLIADVDVEDPESLKRVFTDNKPDVVINCIGLIKHLAHAEDPIAAIQINALLPHLIHKLCEQSGARLIHFSTDCVFNGAKGNYKEEDPSDATDLYGKSKFLGEVGGRSAITLRTSIIGHELQSSHSLLEWFLSQNSQCKGYRRAIFSGFPTTVMAEIVRDIVIPDSKLCGLYHVAAQPISKYELLNIIADVYQKTIEIIPDDELVIDRSLNAEHFSLATGYCAPPWSELIQIMRNRG